MPRFSQAERNRMMHPAVSKPVVLGHHHVTCSWRCLCRSWPCCGTGAFPSPAAGQPVNSEPGARGRAGSAPAEAETRRSALPPLTTCLPGGTSRPLLCPALGTGFPSALSARLEVIRTQTPSGSPLPSFQTPWMLFHAGDSTESTFSRERRVCPTPTAESSRQSTGWQQLSLALPWCRCPTHTQPSTQPWVPPGHPWLAANPRALLRHGSHVPQERGDDAGLEPPSSLFTSSPTW